MEARKITVVPTRAQRTYVINSTAETLGQLKGDLDAAGIDYTDQAFLEGLTKTELKSDESILPKDVQYKGRTTNELVIMLTNVSKKINSGVMSRKKAYAAIKAHNLQDVIKDKFGKNFTLVSTEDLEMMLINGASEDTEKLPEPAAKCEPECAPQESSKGSIDISTKMGRLLTILMSKGILGTEESCYIIGEINKVPDTTCPYSADEIEAMSNF